MREGIRDSMNAKMQTFAQKFTRKGLKTRVISFELERFDNGGRNIHIERNSQVQRLILLGNYINF